MPANGVAGRRGQRHHQERGRRPAQAHREDRRRRAGDVRGDGPGDEFHAEVTVDGEHSKTETFTVPPSGGLRTMLIAALGRRRRGGEAPAKARERRAGRRAAAKPVHAGRHGRRRGRGHQPAGGAARRSPLRRERRADPQPRPSCSGWSTRGTRSTSARARATPPAWRTSPTCRTATRPATRRSLEWHGTAARHGAVPHARERAARAPRSGRSPAPPTRR